MSCCVRGVLLGLTLAGTAAGAIDVPAAPSGYSSSRLYNLGNAYARAGNPGMAVLTYERARLLAPGEADLEANLALVRRAAGIATEPASRLDRTIGATRPATVSWIALTGLLLAAGSLLLSGAGRRAAGLFGTLLIAFTAVHAVAIWPRLHSAVVLTATAPARVSPAPLADAIFTLKEAETVRILGTRQDFLLVRSARGQAGWVTRRALAPICPATERYYSGLIACPPN